MIYQSPRNPNTHLTIKDRQWPSYPTKQLFTRKLISGRVLDFGCGTGIDVAFLESNGFDATGYDPHYAPDYPSGRFDTILCNYVLNILLPEEQAHVLMAVSELLKPTGKAYFTVRRDIKRNGFRTHVKRGGKVYQCNVVLPYKSILSTEHCEIYEYQHINQASHIDGITCPFCQPSAHAELITESATAYALLDQDAASKGHALIIPKQHIAEYFDLSARTKTACWLMVDRVKTLLERRFHPEGYQIVVNTGSARGQDMEHECIHLIPYYAAAASSAQPIRDHLCDVCDDSP